jgi:hypothetical protein
MKQMDFGFPIPEGHKVIFRSCITLKNGTVIYARNYGIRAFPMLVPV